MDRPGASCPDRVTIRFQQGPRSLLAVTLLPTHAELAQRMVGEEAAITRIR
jgi:hypothetical protein